jgi:hypothetical protein
MADNAGGSTAGGAMQFASLLDVKATFGLLYGNESEW